MASSIKTQKILAEDRDLNIENAPISNLNAPKHGTVIPNRVFVGGIAAATTESDLISLFSNYGTVIGTKIISDRAGVSKGYGFVTFETEDEAKRLQNDANNIHLGQRRLNIAPAIKKQSFTKNQYDYAGGSSLTAAQYFQHNGVPYAFQNGMAFFSQQSPIPSSSHVDPSPVFQPGATPYRSVTPSSPGPTYPFPYAPQGQLYYPAQYQYPIPQYDACYDGSQLMVPDGGNIVIPQYYITAQPTPELTFYQPAAIHSQEPSPQPLQHVVYASPRAYESPVIYTAPEPKCGLENGLTYHNGGGTAVMSKEEGEPPQSNQRRARESAPVVSLLKLCKGKEDQPRRKHHQQDEGRRHNLNNNIPDMTNRNLKHHDPRRGTPPSLPPFPTNHTSPNLRHPSVQVPQYPYYPRQVLAPQNALSSFYPPPTQPARPRSYYRPRYVGGRGGGRGSGNSKWPPKEEELGQPLTPPITPRSEAAAAASGATVGAEDVVQSMQALAI